MRRLVSAAALCLLFSSPSKPQTPIFGKAFALYQAGSLVEAKTLLAAEIKRSPAPLELSLLGAIELQLRELDNAEAHIRNALLLEPGLKGARFTLATILEQEGKAEEAEDVLQKILTSENRNTQALLTLSRLSNDRGKTETALAFALKAKASAPDDAAVLYSVGALCLQMDLIEDGTRNLEQSAKLEPNPTTLYALASARVANRDFAAAIQIYRNLLKAEPTNPQVNYALGATYFISGENDLAKVCFERSVSSLPDQVESLYYLGIIASRQDDNVHSIQLLKAAIERQPTHARAHLALGETYRSQGNLEESRRELETAVQLSPESQRAHYQLGLLLASTKQETRAKEELEKAKQLRAVSYDKVSWRLVPQS